MLHVNDTFGQVTGAAVRARRKPASISRFRYDQLTRGRATSIEVSKAKATGADLVCLITRVNDAILIVREMIKQDYNPMAIYGPVHPALTKGLHGCARQVRRRLHDIGAVYDPTRAITRKVLGAGQEFSGQRLN